MAGPPHLSLEPGWAGQGIGCVSAAVVTVVLTPLSFFDHANAFSVGRTRGLVTTIKLITTIKGPQILMDKRGCCLSVWGT